MARTVAKPLIMTVMVNVSGMAVTASTLTITTTVQTDPAGLIPAGTLVKTTTATGSIIHAATPPTPLGAATTTIIAARAKTRVARGYLLLMIAF
mmetsp:Transcript_13760/g.21257  ORF Transcript_13760/g.21257 Transcript_13760/m.21257 type:complete len:94 (+) Transcript_13760:180-461(+)